MKTDLYQVIEENNTVRALEQIAQGANQDISSFWAL